MNTLDHAQSRRAVITYLPELRACAPGRYAEVERATSGLSVSVGADALEVTIPPGTVRDGETFVLVRSVLPLSGTDVPVEGFYRERRRDSRARARGRVRAGARGRLT